MADHEYIPASKKAVYLDKQMFATIMCMIRKRRGFGRAVSFFTRSATPIPDPLCKSCPF